MYGEPGTTEAATIATQETNKSVLELPPEEQKIVVEKAIGVLTDEKVRDDVANREVVVASLGVLTEVLAFKAANIERTRQSTSTEVAIDPTKRDEAVREITESEGFNDIAAKGLAMREARKAREAQNPNQKIEIFIAESPAEQVTMDIVDAWNEMKNVGDPFEISLDAEVNARRSRAIDVATKVAREFVGIIAPQELNNVSSELTTANNTSAPELNLEGNPEVAKASVKEITDTEFFQDLLAKTKQLRAERAAKQNSV